MRFTALLRAVPFFAAAALITGCAPEDGEAAQSGSDALMGTRVHQFDRGICQGSVCTLTELPNGQIEVRNEHGSVGTGVFQGQDRVFVSTWNLGGSLIRDPRRQIVAVEWDNGTEWLSSSGGGGGTYATFRGGICAASQCTFQELSNGNVEVVNERGNRASGYFIGSGRVHINEWNIEGQIDGSFDGIRAIYWSNGTRWFR